MADIAHELTDKELEEMEKRLSAIYARAEKELQENVDKYFKRFEEMDAEKRALVDAGKLTEEEYKRWRQNKIMTGRHWTAMKEQAAQELLQANRTAQEYINGRLPDVYSLNYNSTGEAIEGAVSGYSFELVDASTVKNLATSDKTLLPYKYVDGKKDVRWNTAKVNSEVLQGIVQGESIPEIAKRLRNVTEMNRASAIRNARTTVTSAENKGRMDSLHRAAEKGVITRKVWLAAIDARTREAHRLLNGQDQDIDDPFKSELGDIMFPGDPDAEDPANVYNCRCTLTYKVVGFEKAKWESAESDWLAEQEPKIPETTKEITEKWNIPCDGIEGDSIAACDRSLTYMRDTFGVEPSAYVTRIDTKNPDHLRKYEGYYSPYQRSVHIHPSEKQYFGEDSFTHEFTHAITGFIAQKRGRSATFLDEVCEDIVKKAFTENGIRLIDGKVSRSNLAKYTTPYGGTNATEAVAEAERRVFGSKQTGVQPNGVMLSIHKLLQEMMR